MIFYVDSISGNDCNSGINENDAWKTLEKAGQMQLKGGDRLLLRRGSSWSEPLYITSSGEKDNPIIVSAYGDGPLPVIDSAGEAVVYIQDAEWVELSSLEITSRGPRSSRRSGVLVVATPTCSQKILTHIRIRELYIHDIESENSRDTAGILVKVCQQDDNVPVFYRDVEISDNRLEDIGCTGIVTFSRYGNRSSKNIVDWASSGDWTPLDGLRICKNRLQRIQGEGILVIIAQNVRIEQNELRECCMSAAQIYTGIWCHSSENCLLQYNLVSDSSHGFALGANMNCKNTCIRHNLSQNNGLGFIHLCTDGEGRFNNNIQISGNYSFNDQSVLFHFLGELQDIEICNNVFYTYHRYFVGVFALQMWIHCQIDVKHNLFYCVDNDIRDIYIEKNLYPINSLRYAKFTYTENAFYRYIRVAAMKKNNLCLRTPLFGAEIENVQELKQLCSRLGKDSGIQPNRKKATNDTAKKATFTGR